MRDLSLADRNKLIAEAGDKVLDLRPALAKRISQRIAAERYRGAFRPKGPTKA
jgi:hypothetical protein